MKKIAFICVHNSCRSQMAEAWAKHLGGDLVDVYSAGTQSYHEIKPLAIAVMHEVGVLMKDQYPKLISQIPKPDILITMGCGATCPWLPNDYHEDWNLEDPSGKSIEDFRITRELIKEKVINLLQKIKS